MNRTVRPVSFAFEADVVSVFANILFGAAGAPSFVVGTTTQSNNVPTNKGLCNIALKTYSFTGTTDGSTAVVTAVSNFTGLYVGMTVTGTGIPAATTISSMNAGAATITLSANTTSANVAEAMSASGGAYTLTFGSNFALGRLDTYVRLLSIAALWNEDTLQGGVSTLASSPSAPVLFVVNNSVAIAGSASITFQLGKLTGTTFVAEAPANGEKLKLGIQLTRSSAI